MNGFLLVYKEKGFSSNEIVQNIKKNFLLKKVGHLGTLDPEAEGLLIIAINRATKFSNYFLNSDKSYFVEIRLGIVTDTDDGTGKIIKKCEVICSKENVKKEIKSFLGESFQKPPFFSALKHKGKPLYKYARNGQFIDKEPRKIEIKQIKNITYRDSICSFQLTCTKGTYIRSLARDLGENLGCGAHMKSLIRLTQHSFDVENALTVKKISTSHLIKIDDAFKEYKKITLNKEDLKIFKNGGRVNINSKSMDILRIYDQSNDFVGIGSILDNHLKHKQLV
ncbi:tRNA pseudouridine(55) synthase TruB [Gammaproteobacteria bacterium]|nr:tRNA pseudouridine(55) synthase TruB [Gammaproteobacteria bacterium]